MINQWMSAKEIAALPGMPSTIQGVHKKARRDGWQQRKQAGVKGPGIEYLVEVNEVTPSTRDRVEEQVPVYLNQFMEEFALISGYQVQVSAGHGASSQGEQEPYRHLPFPRKWLRKRGFYENELAIVWCKGDSMEPTISDSATLVVHLGRTRPIDGRIYVVRNDDQLWVKRLQVRPDAWVLISDNTIYPPMTIKKHEQHTFEVIGQVVHISHDVGE